MTTADTPAAAAAGAKPGLVDQLRANPRLPLMIVAAAAAIALIAGMLLWSVGPSYGVLYSGLSDRDGGDIIAQLDQMQVPYQFAANGSTILVPSDSIDQTRLTLAGQGLPKGAGVGFELMDNQSFGISQFAEHVNYKRALEGELARSIETVTAVASARVHLAIPESTVFVRDREKPSASIVLDLYSGRTLSDGQVNAIVNLVASSVTNLPTDAVTVVDGSGHLLSASGSKNNGVDGTQLKYVARIEDTYRKSIESILAPIVGRDNIRAQVVADIDFSVGEHTEELYGPNQDPRDAAVRSRQRSVSSNNGGTASGGVPGALSNRPSPDAASPINNPKNRNGAAGGQNAGLNMSGRAGLATGGSSDGKSSASSSSTTNYEVNRTIRHIREETGRIQRISAAVVINYPMQTSADKKGEKQAVPLSDQRMAQIKRLVREAIGFSADRGDTLEVVNAPFTEQPGPVVAAAPPWWKDPQIQGLIKKVLKYLLIAIVAWLAWRKFIRPLLHQMANMAVPRMATAGGPAFIAGDDPDDDDPGANSADTVARKRRKKQHDALLRTTQDVAKNDPRLVAMIVKNWMHGNG